jgi:hypothetical protein
VGGLVAALREEVVALRRERREMRAQATVQERVVRRLEEVRGVNGGCCLRFVGVCPFVGRSGLLS